MNNNRPLSKRKQVQLLVLLTILAWATQTMLHQLGYGQEVPTSVTQTDGATLAAMPDLPASDENSFPATPTARPKERWNSARKPPSTAPISR